MSAQTGPDVLDQRKVADSIVCDDDPSMAHDARTKVRAYLQKGKAKAVEMEEGFEHYVQAKPMKSVLIAAGAGLLVGYLFGRRR